MSQQPQFENDASHQLQNGIFSFVIQLCKHMEKATGDSHLSREWVAQYLESIAHGLRDIDNDTTQEEETT